MVVQLMYHWQYIYDKHEETYDDDDDDAPISNIYEYSCSTSVTVHNIYDSESDLLVLATCMPWARNTPYSKNLNRKS